MWFVLMLSCWELFVTARVFAKCCLCIAACVCSSCICTTTLLLVSCLPVLRNCHPAVTEHDFVVKIYHSKSTWSDDFHGISHVFWLKPKGSRVRIAGSARQNLSIYRMESIRKPSKWSSNWWIYLALPHLVLRKPEHGSIGECFSRKWWFPQCVAKTSWVLNVPSSPK